MDMPTISVITHFPQEFFIGGNKQGVSAYSQRMIAGVVKCDCITCYKPGGQFNVPGRRVDNRNIKIGQMRKQDRGNFGIFNGKYIPHFIHPQSRDNQLNLVIIECLADGVGLFGIRFVFPGQNPL